MVLLLGRIGILLCLLGLVAACATGAPGETAPAPTTAPLAPTAPSIPAASINPPAIPTTSAAPPTAASATNHELPQALDDVTATQVFRFRVDPAQTTVEYAVQEVLLSINQITRGRTNAVEGEFQLYMQNGKAFIALSNLQVDLRTLTTDSSVRDQAIRGQWLESDKYPKAIFVANTIAGLPSGAVQGQPYTFQVSGDMTIRNITRPVTFDVTVTVKDNSILGEGKTIIFMKDFGIDPPNIIGQTVVSDPATITIKGLARLIDD